MRIAALDLSLTRTGYALGVREGLRGMGTLTPPGLGLPRLQWIRDRVLWLADAAELVVLEGYSYASKGRAVINIGELGGVVRLALFEAGHIIVEIPPATVKKLATGKGNVNKNAVLVAAVKRLGYEGSDDNEADALWLLEAAKQHYGLPRSVDLPVAHLSALEKIRWPDTVRSAA